MAGIILVVSDRPESDHEKIRAAVTTPGFRCEIVPHDFAAMEWLRQADPKELVGVIVDQKLPDNEEDGRGYHPEFGVGREYTLDQNWLRFVLELTDIAKWYRPVARVIVLVCANPNYPGGNLQWMLDTQPLQWIENVARPLPIQYHDPIGSEGWDWPEVVDYFGAMLLLEFQVLSDWETEQARAKIKQEENTE